MTSPEPLEQDWDVIIVGTGAAGLTAALSAATTATSPRPRILLLDKAPEAWAGGNGHFTAAAYRTVHAGLPDVLPLVSNVPAALRGKVELPAYGAGEFEADLWRVTGGRADEGLARVLVDDSLETVRWLRRVGGVDWWLSFRRQAYEVDGRWVFWGGLCLTVEGGGKGLVAGLSSAVRRAGCEVRFDAAATGLMAGKEGEVEGVTVESGGRRYRVRARSVILCAGGFEASPELRGRWLGPGWKRAHTRGTPFNTGEMLLQAAGLGAKLMGDFSTGGCHSVAWDADSPADGGDREKTNEFTKSGYPLGLMLQAEGKRFVDEGVDLRNYTYARFGRAILEQPDGIAWQIWDRAGQEWLRQEEYRDGIVRKTWADSIGQLARKLEGEGLRDAAAFVETIEEYNAAVAAHRAEHPEAKLNPAVRDGLSTQSSSKRLVLAKSNWATPMVEPPFMAVKVTTGITFTFGGLAIVPETAAVLREDGGGEIPGLYCAGEMVGGLFWGNYPGGSGLTAGGVFGRRAGRAAVERAERLGRVSRAEV